MNISEEKERIVKRICEEQDAAVIYAVKELLDSDLSAQDQYDAALEKALDHAVKQSENGEGRPHEKVWAEISNRYKL